MREGQGDHSAATEDDVVSEVIQRLGTVTAFQPSSHGGDASSDLFEHLAPVDTVEGVGKVEQESPFTIRVNVVVLLYRVDSMYYRLTSHGDTHPNCSGVRALEAKPWTALEMHF